MVHFVSALKVQLLLWTLLIVSTSSIELKGQLDEGLITRFIQQLIKPYMERTEINNSLSKAVGESIIEKAIRLKVNELKPMLRDNEGNLEQVETEDNLTLYGNDETTIIEFIPKPISKKKNYVISREMDSFQMNINKYKQLRQTIKKILEKERVTGKTKKLITRTLDEMIAQLIESQCTWKVEDSLGLQKNVFRTLTDTQRSMNKLQKLTSQDWKGLRKQYLNFLHFKKGNEDNLIKQFHDFFSNVINDTWNLAQRYKVRCQLVDLDNNSSPKQFLREEKTPTAEKKRCDSFKVCSEELKEFLNNFYTYLNDTAVSTFRNYAAMYVRDVNVDTGLEKDTVVSVIDNFSHIAERKVSKIFRKEINKLVLDDEKRKRANIEHIRNFITNTGEQVKKILKKNLDFELGAMKTKLFSTVKKDINVNLMMDMNNLEQLYIDRVCSFFVLCNGKYESRRLHNSWTFRPKDNNNIYVKVQMTLDDEFKQSLSQIGSSAKTWQGKDMTYRSGKKFKIDNMKYSNISVTRTTVRTAVSTTEDTTTVRTNVTTLPEKEVIGVEGITFDNNI